MATSLAPTSSETACDYCGNRLSDQYARVFGDQDDCVDRCPECDSEKRLSLGSAAGKDVDWPDPQEYPERKAGDSV
jgi:DNA-directed RNA polymerase subunit RPC12/RpoP